MFESKELKKFLDAKKTEPRLLGDVERYLMRKEPSPRRTDVLHPSEIIKSDWCHRYAFYLLKGGESKKEKPSLRLQNIFDEGHAIHAKWQNRFREMGVLYGMWHGPIGKGWNVASNVDSEDEYLEVPLKDEALRIHGHADGWIKGIGNDCLIEIKSIGAGTLRFEAPDLLLDANNDLTKAWKGIRKFTISKTCWCCVGSTAFNLNFIGHFRMNLRLSLIVRQRKCRSQNNKLTWNYLQEFSPPHLPMNLISQLQK